jgi:hypothetical protein
MRTTAVQSLMVPWLVAGLPADGEGEAAQIDRRKIRRASRPLTSECLPERHCASRRQHAFEGSRNGRFPEIENKNGASGIRRDSSASVIPVASGSRAGHTPA